MGMKMGFSTQSQLNIIRGKSLVSKATPEDIRSVFFHLDALEMKLDELDEVDAFGTEGWRHAFGLPDSD